jgi:hypothetical protein
MAHSAALRIASRIVGGCRQRGSGCCSDVEPADAINEFTTREQIRYEWFDVLTELGTRCPESENTSDLFGGLVVCHSRVMCDNDPNGHSDLARRDHLGFA